ncbi:MAG: endolytic transglycosylase MltG [bacterium]|nr:endolytic transglycosylase MltG [bacterium]
MEDSKINPLKVVILVPAVSLALLAVFLIYSVYSPSPIFQGKKSVNIDRGLGSRKIADLLKKEGVIQSKWVFVTYVSLKGVASDLKPGEYEFSSGDSIVSMTKSLIKGGKNEVVITIPEGWTNKEIIGHLEQNKLIKSNVFHNLAYLGGDLGPPAGGFEFLKDRPDNASLEGYLFPDTYRFFKDASEKEILLKFLQNFEKKLSVEFSQEIKDQGKSIFEIVTMASLIENEVVSDEDRALVSGILWKRLEKKLPLQVDATLGYIKKHNLFYAAKFIPQDGHRFSKEDTKIDSPYNTYKYLGLPLGPISNPGLSAIKAGIFPEKSPYFYYLSTPDGKTIFSKTLEEHNKAKAKYLQ